MNIARCPALFGLKTALKKPAHLVPELGAPINRCFLRFIEHILNFPLFQNGSLLKYLFALYFSMCYKLQKGYCKMKIGYARVSTEEQNLDLQIAALEKAGCDRIFTDKGISGLSAIRDGLAEAEEVFSEGDVFVIWKLDRLGRSLAFLIAYVNDLKERGLHFQSIADGIDTTTPQGKFFFHITGAVAEFESSLISLRTKEGMAIAKKKGVHVGRKPKLTLSHLQYIMYLKDRGTSLKRIAANFGVSYTTLWRFMQKHEKQAS